MLLPLEDNGGTTLTHMPLPGSLAINNGSEILAVDHVGQPLLTDQRGTSWPRVVGSLVDIGSVEANCPSIPTGLAVLAGDARVTLTWDAAPEPDVLYYKLNRATNIAGPFNVVAVAFGGNNITDFSVYNDTTYYYQISAINTTGYESLYSAIVEATPTAGQPEAEPVFELTVDEHSDAGTPLMTHSTVATADDIQPEGVSAGEFDGIRSGRDGWWAVPTIFLAG